MRSGSYRVLLLAVVSFAMNLALADPSCAEEKQWATIKGQVIWEGDVPKPRAITITTDQEVCSNTKPPLDEDYIINPKNKGVKNVFVWIRPTGAAKSAAFPNTEIHPSLTDVSKELRVIDIPCCKFEPHALAAREGETLFIKNSSKVAHNVHIDFTRSDFPPSHIVPAADKLEIPKLVAEPGLVLISCRIHPWMRCDLRVFDHPYFAITDDNGKFEIKLAPTGNYSVFVHSPANGWLNGVAGKNGTPVKITADGLDMGQLKMKLNKR